MVFLFFIQFSHTNKSILHLPLSLSLHIYIYIYIIFPPNHMTILKAITGLMIKQSTFPDIKVFHWVFLYNF